MINSNAVSVNKEKITGDLKLSETNLINKKYILIQKGKKNYYLIIVS
jgi:tyrosyl-tRNA synthetase